MIQQIQSVQDLFHSMDALIFPPLCIEDDRDDPPIALASERDDQSLPPMMAVSMIAMIAPAQAYIAKSAAALENILSEGVQANPPHI